MPNTAPDPTEGSLGASADADRAASPAGLSPEAGSSQVASHGARFTPGPWTLKVDPYDDIGEPIEPFCTITAGDGGYMGRGGFEMHGIAPEADARLIASAPDLYEAAERALNYIANTEGEFAITLESGEMLRAALAKARGQ